MLSRDKSNLKKDPSHVRKYQQKLPTCHHMKRRNLLAEVSLFLFFGYSLHLTSEQRFREVDSQT